MGDAREQGKLGVRVVIWGDWIREVWHSIIDGFKRLLKRDAPHLKIEAGQELYINGVRYIITGMNLDMRGHVDIQTQLALQYRKERSVR